jgi:hypothetical protein
MNRTEFKEEEKSPNQKMSENSLISYSLSLDKKINYCSRENSILLDTILGTSPMDGLQYDTELYLDRYLFLILLF